MITYLQNSFTIPGETSPVNAPFSSQCRFWAPNPISVPISIAEIGISAINGGQRTHSTDVTSCSPGTISATNPRASSMVLFIFQLPATNGVRMKDLPVKKFSKMGQLYIQGRL